MTREKEGGRSAAGEGGPAGAPDGSGGCARRGSGGGIRADGEIWTEEKRCSAMGVPADPATETPGTTGKRRPLPGGRRRGVQKIFRMITKNGISP